MKIVEKMRAKQENLYGCSGVTIGFLGDSVTQGCFEIYEKGRDAIETVFDQNHGYHYYLKRILSMLYSGVPVNIINGGISGSNAPQGLERLDRDILCHQPDLVVVCFGLNDSMEGIAGISKYTDALSGIFNRLKEANVEIIFMTPNMMNSDMSYHLEKEAFSRIAKQTMAVQNDGIMDAYMNAAKGVCLEYGVPVCDCYSKWKKLEKGGVIISDLLANYINHPTRNMNWLFAVSLAELMFDM